MSDFLIHLAMPVATFLFLLACLFLDCDHVTEEVKQREESECEIKDNIRGRKIFLGFLCLLALVWILTPLKK